ncbi:flavodoxin domain-containing protein [Patulibacter sp. SYSU D01012]|uniref:flavodoxin domain-containing protein n=1 Tax=Patulibacter sp. SYSU D01012 TaxID=2817381 RepID=UPI001B31477E|nr:flavodoxin domain-containing protein [Patulibacter sp. SYSU D01012]
MLTLAPTLTPPGGRPGGTVLVAFASAHGTTREIAERIASRLHLRGIGTVLADVAAEPLTSVAAHDRVVVAAPVRGDHHHPAMVAWLQLRARELAGRDVSLVSVSLSAASGDAWAGRTARYVETLAAETGVRPDRVLQVGGALRYRSATVATRLRMKRVAAVRHLDTDASRDHGYTDWDAVDGLVGLLARAVHGGAGAALRLAG